MNPTMTADELDAAILAVLRATPEGCGWWAEIRSRLPASTFWQPIKSLVRLVEHGQVHTTRIGGRDFVCLAITLGPAA